MYSSALPVFAQCAILGISLVVCSGETCKTSQDEVMPTDSTALLQGRIDVGQLHERQGREWAASMTENWPATKLLQSVQSMGKSAGPPKRDLSQLKEIKSIVVGTLLPALLDAQSYFQQELDLAKTQIDRCLTKAHAELGGVVELNVSTTTAEKDHATCRDSEKVLNDDMTTKCDSLQTYLNHLRDTFESPPKQAAFDVINPYLENQYNSYLLLQEKYKLCQNATEVHTTKKTKCDTEQAAFESDFCQYRTKVLDAEGEFTFCHGTTLEHYNNIKKQAEDETPKWQAEYIAIKKIECFLDVWLSDDDLSTLNKSASTECQKFTPDPDTAWITYPDILEKNPDEATKSLDMHTTLVTYYPGTAGFLGRYSGLPTHKEEIAECLTYTTTTTTPYAGPPRCLTVAGIDAGRDGEYVYDDSLGRLSYCRKDGTRVISMYGSCSGWHSICVATNCVPGSCGCTRRQGGIPRDSNGYPRELEANAVYLWPHWGPTSSVKHSCGDSESSPDGSSADRALESISAADALPDGLYYIKTSSTASQQMQVSHHGGRAWALVMYRKGNAKELFTQDAVGSPSQNLDSLSNFKLSDAEMKYLTSASVNGGAWGVLLVPYYDKGYLDGNLLRSGDGNREYPIGGSTANNAGDMIKSKLNAPSYPAGPWDTSLETNSHCGGTQVWANWLSTESWKFRWNTKDGCSYANEVVNGKTTSEYDEASIYAWAH